MPEVPEPSPELERAYRRLLLAYPAFYRRERGLEMLTTLLDAAEPGQVRPSRDEALYLLVTGLRYRFVAPTRVGKVAAALVMVWAALVFSGAGALAVWGFADPTMPVLGDESAGRSATSVYEVPGDGLLDMAHAYPASSEFQSFGDEGWDGRRPAPMGQIRVYEQVPGAPAVVSGIYQRLTGAGWQTGTLSETGVFWASRDGVLMRVARYDGAGGLTVSAFPAEPRGVLAGAVAGFIVGLIVAAQVMAWLAHRTVRVAVPVRRLILLVGLPALIACVVNTVDTVLSMVPDPDTASVLLAADFMYPLASQIADPLAAGVVGFGLLAAVGLLFGAGRWWPVRSAKQQEGNR